MKRKLPILIIVYCIFLINKISARNYQDKSDYINQSSNFSIYSHYEFKPVVYPNPSNGSFTLENNSASKLKIYNSIGMLLIETDFEKGEHPIDLKLYNNGIFFAVLENETERVVLKLIKKE